MARPFEKYFYHESFLKYIDLFATIMSDLKVDTERGLMEVPLHMAIGRRNDLNRNVPSNMLPFATFSFGQFEPNKSVTKSFHNRCTNIRKCYGLLRRSFRPIISKIGGNCLDSYTNDRTAE